MSTDGASSPSAPRGPEPRGLRWREIERGLWVIRTEDRHVGVIERRRRYSVTGSGSRTRIGLRTFADALRVLELGSGSAPGALLPVPGRRRSPLLTDLAYGRIRSLVLP